jgi:hypothetical protein
MTVFNAPPTTPLAEVAVAEGEDEVMGDGMHTGTIFTGTMTGTAGVVKLIGAECDRGNCGGCCCTFCKW